MPLALDDILDDLRSGDLIGAYDRSRQRLDAGSDDPRLRYLSVLALARSGATRLAVKRYRELRLHRVGDVDSASLWARIRKDAAFAAPPETRRGRLASAASRYAAVFRATGDPFPGINAATLSLLAGETHEAERIAAALLADGALAAPDEYYGMATRAEALTILGRWDEAALAFGTARGFAGGDLGAISTSRRQLSALLGALAPSREISARLMTVLRAPTILLLDAGEVAVQDREAVTREAIAALSGLEVGVGIAALWTSGSLLLAEAILAKGAALHLVLPFGPEDVVAQIGAFQSPATTARFTRCIAAATTVTAATADGDVADPKLIEYARQIAEGLAEGRARNLSTSWIRFAAMRGTPAILTTGRAARSGHRSRGEPAGPPPAGFAAEDQPSRLTTRLARDPVRELRTLLFADVHRFSDIPEARLPAFFSDYVAGLAETIRDAGAAVLDRNTWGDAIHLVLSDIAVAADLALALQERAAVLRARGGWRQDLRIGLHHGPVFRAWDPIRNAPTYIGTQVSRAARVEPVVPPGAVYVTEPFAAILALEGGERFEAEYAGLVTLPKNYGKHRLYRLARRWPPAG